MSSVKKRKLEIINHRLTAVPSPYKFATAYRKKSHIAKACMAASCAAGIGQLSAIRNSSVLVNPFKHISLVKAVINTYSSMNSAYKFIMGDKPYSFREVYGKKSKPRIQRQHIILDR